MVLNIHKYSLSSLIELFSSNLCKQTLSFNLSTPRQFFKVTFPKSDRGLHPGTWAVLPLWLEVLKPKPLWIVSGKFFPLGKQRKANQQPPKFSSTKAWSFSLPRHRVLLAHCSILNLLQKCSDDLHSIFANKKKTKNCFLKDQAYYRS